MSICLLIGQYFKFMANIDRDKGIKTSTLNPLFNSKTKCAGVRISIFSTNALNISSSNSLSSESLLFIVSFINGHGHVHPSLNIQSYGGGMPRLALSMPQGLDVTRIGKTRNKHHSKWT